MRILLATPEFPPHHIGGGGEAYKQLAEKYTQSGHQVTIIYGYYPNEKWNDGVKKDIENDIVFYQVPEIPYPKSKPFLRTAMPITFKAAKQLKKIVRKEDFDVAHLHGYGWPFTNKIASLCIKQNIPYILTIHGYPESQNNSLLGKIIWNLFIKKPTYQTMGYAKQITGVSDYIRSDDRNLYKEKSMTVYAGLDQDNFKKIQNSINIRKNHHIDADEVVIYSLGRITRMKGFQDIIKLVKDLKNNGIKAKYLIAGDDEGYKDHLISLAKELDISENIIFVGFQDLETKKQYINQCDFYAIPSLWEPFGLVALEGAFFNKAIISSQAGGLKEILDGYNNLIDLNSRDIIEKIINFKPRPNNFDFSKFDWNNIAQQYLNILTKSLN